MKNIIHSIIIFIFLLFYHSIQEIINNQTRNNSTQNSQLLPIISKIMNKFYAGEIHYSRIPVQYWEHRILMIKAMGLNALSVYVMWNYHEIEKGKFDFQTENKNLQFFLNLAEKYNMAVLLRPGPYVCAEWDFGGFPVRLYSVPNLKIRSNNVQFLDEVKIYFNALVPIIKPHLKTQSNPKGSIFLLQIQNQYGSYGSDLDYIAALRKIWIYLGIECEMYHEDGSSKVGNSHWIGGHIGLSDGNLQKDYTLVRSLQKDAYIFGGQIYTGWLTHWGEDWKKKSTEHNVQKFQTLLKNNHSFSMYMVHGGTNFGLTAGANAAAKKLDYAPTVTSYDYDSPINEQGGATPKYYALRQLLLKYVDWPVPSVPLPIKMIQIPKFKVKSVASMLQNLDQPSIQNSQEYFPFESQELKMYDQGLVIYQTFLTKRIYNFKVTVRDFAIILLDNVHVAALDRSISIQHNFTVNCHYNQCSLKIIVEAMGHINYAHGMDNDIKGLFNFSQKSKVGSNFSQSLNQSVDVEVDFIWNMYPIRIDNNLLNWSNFNPSLLYQPTLLQASINLQKIGDTYFDMSQFTKGYLFVNGRNLGRYWNRGPQKRLYCPGVWLKQGKNTIQVLEVLDDGMQKGITGQLTLQKQTKLIVQV